MSMRRMAVLQAGLLLVAMFANAASRNNTMRIKVLDSETRALNLADNGVPKNCDEVTFDAYCRSTRTAPLVSTLLVQDGNAPPFRISCTIESRFSRCTPLPIGTTFDARREKRGITVYFVDEKGRARSELYKVVADAKAGSPAPAATAAAPAATAVTAAPAATVAPAATNAPVADPPIPAPAENAAQAPAAAGASVGTSSPPPTVKCSFNSTPAGAEVTLDGRYVGSTPSVLGLGTGTHVVVMSLPGFAQWKRELTVASGSDLTVNAVLQKGQ